MALATTPKNQARLAALTRKQRVAEHDSELGSWCVYDDGRGLIALSLSLDEHAPETVKGVFAPADWSLADLKQFLRSDGRSN